MAAEEQASRSFASIEDTRSFLEGLFAHAPVGFSYMPGYADDAVVRHGILQGSVAFIEKPFSSEALATTVRDVLGRPPGA